MSRNSRTFSPMFHVLTGLGILLLLPACNDGGNNNTGNTGSTGGGNTLDCTTVIPGASLADDYVCAHNANRESVPAGQPIPNPALPAMTWNQSLADWAQTHVNACNFVHSDSGAAATQFGQPVGENMFAAAPGGWTPDSVVQNWVSEAANYDYATNTCTGTCGHYTQVVWRTSIEVGCAVATCPTLTGTGMTNAQFVSCNYLAAGNYVGQKPY